MDEKLLKQMTEVYMTDPVCKAAVERYMTEHDLRATEWHKAAQEVAKKVVPAPHNLAAQDARYLLAPETEQLDEDLYDWHMRPGMARGAEQFMREAHTQAQYDGPETAEGAQYSRGLSNRAGVEVSAGSSGEAFESFLEAQLLTMEVNDSLYEDSRTGHTAPLPPSLGEVEPDAALVFSATFIEPLTHLRIVEVSNEVWEQELAEFVELVDEAGLVPTGPIQIREEPFGSSSTQFHLSVTAVPANERPFLVTVVHGPRDEVAEELGIARAAMHGCRRVEWTGYDEYTSVIAWDLHPHVPVTVRSEEADLADAEELLQFLNELVARFTTGVSE